MFQARVSTSNALSLDEVVAHLSHSNLVEGVALFGSSLTTTTEPTSDYDLLVMLSNPPVHIFQMQTYIAGRIADIAFVETDTADRVLALDKPVSPTSSEGYLIGWLEGAQIVYDGEARRLERIQQKLKSQDWRWHAGIQDFYADWFWLNFDLRHIQRMAASNDPLYLMVVDMRLMACISGICRAYCRLHGVHWRGEKAALRYLQAHDPHYFELLQQAVAEVNRTQRITLCEQLVERTLADVGGLWPAGATAAYLKDPAAQPERVEEAFQLWEQLLIYNPREIK
jgi:predicted nucleotidyltransferase